MRVYPSQLSRQLNQSLPGFILIHGEEPMQRLEALDSIRQAALTQGFDERLTLTLDGQFEWGELASHYQSMSLFASRTLIELQLEQLPSTEVKSSLTELLAQPNPDVILVIHSGKLNSDISKQAWFKKLSDAGLYVPCYPLEGDHLKKWIQQQLRQLKLQATPEAITLLANDFAGNLLALKQEINKLPLLFNQQQLTPENLTPILTAQARHTPFEWVDAIISGKNKKAMRLMDRLRAEETETTVIAWALQKELTLVSQLQLGLARAIAWPELVRQHKIWKSRAPLLQYASQHLPHQAVNAALDELAQLDIALKQSHGLAAYQRLAHIGLALSHPQLNAFNLHSHAR